MVRVNYIRREVLSISKVREMCIRYNFYTHGNNEQYSKMFELCSGYDGTTDKLAHIAWDIVDHSDEEELDDYGFDTVYEIVAWVMSLLTQEAMNITYIAKEVE